MQNVVGGHASNRPRYIPSALPKTCSHVVFVHLCEHGVNFDRKHVLSDFDQDANVTRRHQALRCMRTRASDSRHQISKHAMRAATQAAWRANF
jgi:hypothetical protein